jgi:hypothetical protein
MCIGRRLRIKFILIHHQQQCTKVSMQIGQSTPTGLADKTGTKLSTNMGTSSARPSNRPAIPVRTQSVSAGGRGWARVEKSVCTGLTRERQRARTRTLVQKAHSGLVELLLANAHTTDKRASYSHRVLRVPHTHTHSLAHSLLAFGPCTHTHTPKLQ